MDQVNYNGLLKNLPDPLFSAHNRAFRYGDGLFESMRMFEGYIPLLDRHVYRLMKGLKTLRFELPAHYGLDFFQTEIQKLISTPISARIRLSVFRQAGGLYTPISNRPAFLIEAIPLESNRYEFAPEGLEIGLYTDHQLPCHPLSNLKASNSLIYVLASMYRKENGLGECILLNHKGWVAEGCSSNVFLVKKEALYTPPLSEGIIPGIMRELVIERSPLPVKQIPIYPDELETADEIFLTNAVQGIKWVKSYKNTTFNATVSKHISQLVNQHLHEENTRC
ncbi:MAG: aminotransferase class IV [Bacteroidota bacterium]